MSNNEGDVSKNAFVTVISTRLKLQTVEVSFPWNLIFGTKPGGVLDISLGGEVRRGPSYPDPV